MALLFNEQPWADQSAFQKKKILLSKKGKVILESKNSVDGNLYNY